MHKRTYLSCIFLALAALGIGQALGLLLNSSPKEMESAVLASQPLLLTGEVIVEMTPVYAPEPGFWTRTAPEGRVSPGQTLFTGPVSTADTADRVRLLDKAQSGQEMSLPQRREALHSALEELYAGTGDMVEVMGLVLAEPSEAQADQARQQLALEAGQCREITAPDGGVFISVPEGDTLGHIITDTRWQLSLELPFSLSRGDRLCAQLLCGIFQWVEFSVEQVEMTGQGCRVLLSCDAYLTQVAKIRNLTVKILPE